MAYDLAPFDGAFFLVNFVTIASSLALQAVVTLRVSYSSSVDGTLHTEVASPMGGEARWERGWNLGFRV